MSRWWPVQPGVTAMGHVTGGGAWHPGSGHGCTKCAPRTLPVVHKTRPDAYPLCGPTRGFWAEGSWAHVTCPSCLAMRDAP
jgi:hypothetical protein